MHRTNPYSLAVTSMFTVTVVARRGVGGGARRDHKLKAAAKLTTKII